MKKETKCYQTPLTETVTVNVEGILCESADIATFKMENETWEW